MHLPHDFSGGTGWQLDVSEVLVVTGQQCHRNAAHGCCGHHGHAGHEAGFLVVEIVGGGCVWRGCGNLDLPARARFELHKPKHFGVAWLAHQFQVAAEVAIALEVCNLLGIHQ